MMDVAVVLDASALCAYVEGNLAVGELIAEIADERRLVAIPAACLAQARAGLVDDLAAAHLLLLTTTPTVTVLPLAVDELGQPDPIWQVGEFARDAGGDIATGHAVRSALEHEAYYATTDPAKAAAVLPAGWGVLDLNG